MAKKRSEPLEAFIPYMMSTTDENVDWIKLVEPERTREDQQAYEDYWKNYKSPYETKPDVLEAINPDEIEDGTAKAFDPTQPRWPKGLPKSGQWRQVAPSDFDEPVWKGKQQEAGKRKWSKNEAGNVGEKVVARVLTEMLGEDFETLNIGKNNAPIDLISHNWMVEVKAGIAHGTNPQWRATIGEPGDEEKALLAQMTSKDKLEHNNRKRAAIMQRKQDLVDSFTQMRERKMNGATATVILSPEGDRADVFLFPGFHLRIGWNAKDNDQYYVGTYKVDKE